MGTADTMTVKLTVIYDIPTDPDAFEQHYSGEHVTLVPSVPDVQKVETAKVFPKEDGSPTPAYRTADLYFADYDTAVTAISSDAGQKLLADARELGSAGVKFLLSDIGA
jgi:uncharacterized protein (TIGR02118 family)